MGKPVDGESRFAMESVRRGTLGIGCDARERLVVEDLDREEKGGFVCARDDRHGGEGEVVEGVSLFFFF